MSEDNQNILIRNWLYINAFMVFCMAIIGAITRLTESGLSMVEWRPLIGSIPPISETEWLRVFNLYRETPEYQKINVGMGLNDFKTIFFWEWFHRLWGRLIGLVYAIPLLIFWIKGIIPDDYKKTLLGLLFLGSMQAVMGYVMVLSGLVDRPSVSHYRLAAHLSLAFIIFGCLLWTAFSLSNIAKNTVTFCKWRHGWSALCLLAITIIWGAFMAGKDAGLVSSSWPHMYQGSFIPDDLFHLSPSWISIFEYEVTIHFMHRWLAFFTLIALISYAYRIKSFPLTLIALLQFALGIVTIMSGVSITIATLHQAGALILTGLLLKELYRNRYKSL